MDGVKLICPVCNKAFETTEDTCYFISGGYACSWKCFLQEVKKRDLEKAERNDKKRAGAFWSG